MFTLNERNAPEYGAFLVLGVFLRIISKKKQIYFVKYKKFLYFCIVIDLRTKDLACRIAENAVFLCPDLTDYFSR